MRGGGGGGGGGACVHTELGKEMMNLSLSSPTHRALRTMRINFHEGKS